MFAELDTLFDPDIDDKLKALNAKYKFKKPAMEVKLNAINGRAFFIREKPLKIEQLSFVRYMYLYAAHLANSSKGKINKFYGHIIVKELDDKNLDFSFYLFPAAVGKGSFKTYDLRLPVDYSYEGEINVKVLDKGSWIENFNSCLLQHV